MQTRRLCSSSSSSRRSTTKYLDNIPEKCAGQCPSLLSLGVKAQPSEVHADVGAEVRMHDVRDVFVLGVGDTLQCLFVVEKIHLHQGAASNRWNKKIK